MPLEGPAPHATLATLGELVGQKSVGRAVRVPKFELLQEVRKTAGTSAGGKRPTESMHQCLGSEVSWPHLSQRLVSRWRLAGFQAQ